MGYRLMLGVAQHCLLLGDRGNKSGLSYRRDGEGRGGGGKPVANVKNTHFQDGGASLHVDRG